MSSSHLLAAAGIFIVCGIANGEDWNQVILKQIEAMPAGGNYARYREDLPEARRFDDLYGTIEGLSLALSGREGTGLELIPKSAASHSFCSSATYLLFCGVISTLQRGGLVASDSALTEELAAVGDPGEVIHGKLDGIGLFGHWNADGPGTAVLFERLDLGSNFSEIEDAKPGDFMKIFWNDYIGKGERGHLVVFLGRDVARNAIQVWSSNLKNTDGTSGYGTMWVDRSRIVRQIFSRLERPENLSKWLLLTEAERTSDYLIRIRMSSSSVSEMMDATGIR